MPDARKPMFAECRRCGERWKLVTLPIDADRFTAALSAARCPGCGSVEVLLCGTDGPGAVTAARDGREVPRA